MYLCYATLSFFIWYILLFLVICITLSEDIYVYLSLTQRKLCYYLSGSSFSLSLLIHFFPGIYCDVLFFLFKLTC